MAIVTSLDYTPSFRERQEYEVMMALEEATRSSGPISTSELAARVVDVLDNLELLPGDDENT